MQSFLITGNDEAVRESAVSTLLKEYKIETFDRVVVESSKSIGIEDIRIIQKSVFLKPLYGSKKAVLVKNAHAATVEAQNALLKLLEEPPPDTIMILTAKKKELLLPTVLSRCSIIEGDERERSSVIDESVKQPTHQIFTVSLFPIAKRLHLAQEMGKTREGALAFLEEATLAAHTALLNLSFGSTTLPAKARDLPPRNNSQLSTLNMSHLLRKLQQTHTIIATTNVSPRLTLEHLLLHL